jgi:hypothetical protein
VTARRRVLQELQIVRREATAGWRW